MELNVVKNAKKNLFLGAINQIIFIVCPFIEKALLNKILGAEYLGVESLFTSILTVLSLSELGFSTAMVYNMYKPAAEGNIVKMNALLAFYKKTYRAIGTFILVLGIAIIPILPRLIQGTYPQEINLVVVYLIFLGNTVISYFMFAYLTSLIVVYQRDDIKSSINSITKIFFTVGQILVLVLFRNYYLVIVYCC